MKYLGFDVETTGLRPYHGDRTFAYCLADMSGKVEVIRFWPRGSKQEIQQRQYLQRVLSDPKIALIAHNLKFELSMLSVDDYIVPEEKELHDTMIIHQMLMNLSLRHGLDEVAYDLCGYSMELDKQVKALADAYGGYHKVPIPLMHKYQIADGERTIILFKTLFPEIEKNPALLADYKNEIALVRVTQQMEEFGMTFNASEANKLMDWLSEQSERVEDKVVEVLGEWVKLSSGDQVANLLYNKLKMPIIALTTGKNPATDEPTISKLREISPHPILDLIVEYRGYIKSLGTIRGYFKHLDKKGKIHPGIKTNHAATGREACAKPNLQNVSKASELSGRSYSERQCFSPDKDCFLVFVDYSGIELRLIVEVTREPEFVELLLSGGDPHAIATEIFFMGKKDITVKKDLLDKKIWKDYRNHAKNAHFAKCYGARLPQVASTLMLPLDQAEIGYNEYCRRFPRMAFYTDDTIELVRSQGYVETPFGRKLKVEKSRPHEGANYIIQGTAAGILKRSQVRVAKYCKDVLNNRVRPVLPIHDEIVFSYPKNLWNERHKILGDISKIMITMPEIKMPLEVEWKYVEETWDKAMPLELYRPKNISMIRRVHA